jgi:hypothetical protein
LFGSFLVIAATLYQGKSSWNIRSTERYYNPFAGAVGMFYI